MEFKIKKEKKESENKTIRFSCDLIKQIEDIANKNDISFSNFVIQACRYAIENMKTK